MTPDQAASAAATALRHAAAAALAARAAYLAGEPGMSAARAMREAGETWHAAATPEAVLAALGADPGALPGPRP